MKCFERLVMAHINTIIPDTLDPLQFAYHPNRSTDDLHSLCNWILDFLSGHPQVGRVGNNSSTTLILNTRAPQGCVLSTVLYSLFTHDRHDSNTIIKFADDTTVVGLITDNDGTAYREEARNLFLNVIKTKEMNVDYRKRRTEHGPILIDGAVVEQVESFKILGVHITNKLTWAKQT